MPRATELNTLLTGILPAAGFSARFHGVPKFLLPILSSGESLIDIQVQNLMEVCDEVRVGVQEKHLELLKNRYRDLRKVRVLKINSTSFSQSIKLLAENGSSERYLLALPDTYVGEVDLKCLDGTAPLQFGVWNCPPRLFGHVGQLDYRPDRSVVLRHQDKETGCSLPYLWGALAFNRDFLDLVNPSEDNLASPINASLAEHGSLPGNFFPDTYFDCGTPEAYIDAYQAANR